MTYQNGHSVGAGLGAGQGGDLGGGVTLTRVNRSTEKKPPLKPLNKKISVAITPVEQPTPSPAPALPPQDQPALPVIKQDEMEMQPVLQTGFQAASPALPPPSLSISPAGGQRQPDLGLAPPPVESLLAHISR